MLYLLLSNTFFIKFIFFNFNFGHLTVGLPGKMSVKIIEILDD